MKLVVDANILLAALLKDAATREILLNERMELFAPEQLLREVGRLLKNPRMRKRLKLNDEELYELSSSILSRIKFIPEKIFLVFIKRSLSLVSHPEDAPYVGLAMALKFPLWSNDSALKEQSSVKVYTTSELIGCLE